jgi:hypothetical protein
MTEALPVITGAVGRNLLVFLLSSKLECGENWCPKEDSNLHSREGTSS